MGLWTKWHAITLIPAFVIMVIAALILRKFLKDKDEKVKMIPIKIIACVIVLLEVAKQIYSIVKGYDLYHIPLHFCSLFIFLLPLFSFYNGKHKNVVRSLMTICSAMLLVFMIIYPTMIYSEYDIVGFTSNFLSFHTVAFHNIVAFACVLIVALNLYEPNTKRDIKSIFIGYGIYTFVAALVSNLIKVNFNGLYRCGVEAIRNIQEKLIADIGWIGQVIYIFGMLAATYLFGLVCYGLYRGVLALIALCKKKSDKKES